MASVKPEFTWESDFLGSNYCRTTINLGDDPDGEGAITATLVKRISDSPDATRPTVLYLHGFTDYFFQVELADAFAEAGYDFYALDLRKCGRSRASGQTAHFVTDLEFYDAELAAALDIITNEHPGSPVVLCGHSTGGLIAALWLDRLRRTDPARHVHISGYIGNSPWFDLQGPALLRSAPVSALIRTLGRLTPYRQMPQKLPGGYGESLHASAHGEWEYNLDYKPLGGFPVSFGWLRAIRRGHAQLQAGIDIGVPSLVLRSARSKLGGPYRAAIDTADAVLDTTQIARWSGCLGNRVTAIPVDGARHDIFLSQQIPRESAYRELATWLSENASLLTRRSFDSDAAGISTATSDVKD